MPDIKYRVDNAEKARIVRAARRAGMTESDLLRAAVHRFLALLRGKPVADREPVEAPGADADASAFRLVQMKVGIPAFMIPELELRAKDHGQVQSRWISSLVQTRLMEKPVFRNEELLALLASNRELAAVGRNVNQMAKHLNASPSDIAEVRLELLHLMYGEIELLRKSILSLVAASNRAWGNDGDH